MTAHRRRLAAVALLWLMAPLPFVGITLPPFWLAAAAISVFVLWRAREGWPVPGLLVQNVLAVVFGAVVLAVGGWSVGPLRPLSHLVLLLASVRLLLVSDRRSFNGSVFMTSVVGVVAIAGSHHVTLLPYIIVSAGLAWWLGMRALLLQRTEEAGGGLSKVRGLPRPASAVAAGLVAVLLGTPLFVVIPRLRSPLLAGVGAGAHVSGFSTAVSLAGVGSIRRSREIALTVDVVDDAPAVDVPRRFRATAFDLIHGGLWRAREGSLRRAELHEDRWWPGGEVVPLDDTVELTIEVLKPRRYLFLPPGTVAVRSSIPMAVDDAGGVLISRRHRRAVTYRVWIASDPPPSVDEPAVADLVLDPRDPEIAALARSAAGDASGAVEKARAISGFVRRTCDYTLDVESPRGVDPVRWFLLEGRAGHCELFAGAMTVLLRHLDVPARMVGGYAVPSARTTQERFYVRESNAHTWVEVWTGPKTGWRTFDPSPAVDLQGELEGPGRGVRWVWDRMQVFWDRYVLTFGGEDQAALIEEVGVFLGTFAARGVRILAYVLLVVGVAVVLVVGGHGIRRRFVGRRGPASAALRGVVRRLRRVGESVEPSFTARDVASMAVERWPAVEDDIVELVRLAEVELYGREKMTADDNDRARRIRRTVPRRLR